MQEPKATGTFVRDIADHRLEAEQYAANFTDIKPPLAVHQAVVESDRCYFCFDAPCQEACPTHIDIPSFIYKIRSGNLVGSAKDILDANIFGAICARVCPVETLCEEACVRNTAEDKPVAIALLQRIGTDKVITEGIQLYQQGEPTGRRIAVVGSGPAGLACAHRLAILGHQVVVYEARAKPGGLNEYGIADYKVTDDIAQREIAYLLEVGGIEVRAGVEVGMAPTLAQLRNAHDAVFLACGLGGVKKLGIDGESATGVKSAVRYIETLRQAEDLATLPVGRRVVVIGGGLTAIDIATQSRQLGADLVTMLYRGGPDQIGATWYERELAQTRDVLIRYWCKPTRLRIADGAVTGIEIERTNMVHGIVSGTRETLDADMVFTAIGQKIVPDPFTAGFQDILDTESGRIRVNANRKTSLDGVWAGGDCIGMNRDLTVTSVEDGKVAARDIHRVLCHEDPIAVERRQGLQTSWQHERGGSRKTGSR